MVIGRPFVAGARSMSTEKVVHHFGASYEIFHALASSSTVFESTCWREKISGMEIGQ